MNNNNIIPLSKPDITDKEIESILEVLRTPYLSLGPKLSEFEEKFADYIGTKHAIAVSSGTAGLHLSIKSLGIGPNDAVITTPFSFIASANCFLFEGATPIFVDIDPDTFNIDPIKIEEHIKNNCVCDEHSQLIDKKSGKRVKAILPVHVFGRPCDMRRILDLAEKYGLYIIEDACEAIGAEFEGKKVGTFGKVGVFAFYPNKQITTGEGGMIVTNDDEIALLCRSLRNQGRDGKDGWLVHNSMGYNYRLSDINCALGVAQLERIDEILKKRACVADLYNEQLKEIVKIPEHSSGTKISWFVYVVCLPDVTPEGIRNEILSELTKKGIGCNNYFPPIHLQPFYQVEFGYKRGDYPITESISKRTIALPFHNNLTNAEISYIVDSLKELLEQKDIPLNGEGLRGESCKNELQYANL